MSEAKAIVAGCCNCRFFASSIVNHQMVTLCRRNPPSAVSGPGGSVGFVQPVVSGSDFCFQYNPNPETQEYSNTHQVPVTVPGVAASPSVAGNGPRSN